jgi:hypothetical protein
VSKQDSAKEQIAYLKFWLGVMVSPTSAWLACLECKCSARKVLGALVAVVVITAAGFVIHRHVERLSEALEDL